MFITISPSERHSGLTLRLIRKRMRDPWVNHGEPDFKALMQRLASADYPSLETVTQDWASSNGCEYAEASLPAYKLRRQAITNDILCCVEAFLVLVKVVLATLLGIRMCPKCPHCNANGSRHPCQEHFGPYMCLFKGLFGALVRSFFLGPPPGQIAGHMRHCLSSSCGLPFVVNSLL